MRRAGKRTIREVRRHRLGVARRNLVVYLILALGFAVLGMIVLPWQPPMMRAFFAGVLVTSYVAAVAYSLTLDGSHFRMMGAEAERWTSAALRKAEGWKVLDRVEFADRDVDHVAVGPAHVLAVETKWTSRPVRVTERGVEGLWCDGLWHAERAAERTKKFLHSKGINQPVIPVLVLWGPGAPRIADGYQLIGDVRVVIGSQADEWRKRLSELPAWSHATQAVLPTLEAYVEQFDQRQQADRGRGLRRLLQRA